MSTHAERDAKIAAAFKRLEAEQNPPPVKEEPKKTEQKLWQPTKIWPSARIRNQLPDLGQVVFHADLKLERIFVYTQKRGEAEAISKALRAEGFKGLRIEAAFTAPESEADKKFRLTVGKDAAELRERIIGWKSNLVKDHPDAAFITVASEEAYQR